MFDVNALDIGVVNTVPAGSPATVVTTAANNTGTINGAAKVIAGAMEDIEYKVVSPPTQVDGVTAATGSFTVKFTYFAQDGTTILDANTFPAQQCSQTVNGASVGTVYTYRTALPGAPSGTVTQSLGLPPTNVTVPEAPHSVQATIVITGVCGALTAGWTLGGHRRNRAG